MEPGADARPQLARPDDQVDAGCSRTGRADHRPGQAVPAQAVLAALETVEVLGGTVREAMGYGRQKDRLHQYLGSEYNSSFLPKVELTLFVHEEHAQEAIKAIVGQARTGRIGDGKIWCCRVSTNT